MPRSKNDTVTTYQFELPVTLKAKGSKKSKENNIGIAQFMRMAYKEFAERPIEESLAQLRKYNRRQTK